MAVSPSPQLTPVPRPHFHLAGECCPYCEQPIPNEKAQEVRQRAEARDGEQRVARLGSLQEMPGWAG